MSRKLVWLGCVAVFGFVLSEMATVRAAEEPSITGNYECVGESGDGKTYRGMVRVTKLGETYLLEWNIGGATHVGIGIIENNRLSSSWATTVGGKVINGVVVYQIEDDKLVGRWAQYPGSGKILKETLTRAK